MYSIDTIPLTNYGLIVSAQQGIPDLPGLKEEFFTVFGTEGFQPVKHQGNVLQLDGYIIASGAVDFKDKTDALSALFSAPGIRSLVLTGAAINVVAMNGFKVTQVHIFNNAAFGRFQIELNVV